MDGLCWLPSLVISGDAMGEVPALGYSNQGNGLLISARSQDQTWPLAASCVGFSLGGDVPGKPICSEAGVSMLLPKQVELVLVCSGSYQSHRIAPRL